MRITHMILLQDVTKLLNRYELTDWTVGITTRDNTEILYLVNDVDAKAPRRNFNVLNIQHLHLDELLIKLDTFLEKHSILFKDIIPKPTYYYNTGNFKIYFTVRNGDLMLETLNNSHIPLNVIRSVISSTAFTVYEKELKEGHRKYDDWYDTLVNISESVENVAIHELEVWCNGKVKKETP